MSPVSRGFRHLHRAPAGQEDRVPPGQYVTDGFPVLSAGPTPHTPLQQWTFSITQGGQTRKSWTWQEFRALPAEDVTTDIHCVTRWSKLDTVWRGVSVDTLLGQVEHDAPYVLAFCDGGYTTNLPIEDVMGGRAWVAYYYDGGKQRVYGFNNLVDGWAPVDGGYRPRAARAARLAAERGFKTERQTRKGAGR
ncbi:MAG TPA: molybdopterin-dependent oxidoreductase [Streptosporangiaceae bacterium]|nr:molybdopterin-dependent oxidoreductase [Streptosporangiaceae bacterium]